MIGSISSKSPSISTARGTLLTLRDMTSLFPLNTRLLDAPATLGWRALSCMVNICCAMPPRSGAALNECLVKYIRTQFNYQIQAERKHKLPRFNAGTMSEAVLSVSAADRPAKLSHSMNTAKLALCAPHACLHHLVCPLVHFISAEAHLARNLQPHSNTGSWMHGATHDDFITLPLIASFHQQVKCREGRTCNQLPGGTELKLLQWWLVCHLLLRRVGGHSTSLDRSLRPWPF